MSVCVICVVCVAGIFGSTQIGLRLRDVQSVHVHIYIYRGDDDAINREKQAVQKAVNPN